MRNPPILTGRLLLLEPLHPDHAEGLVAAAAESRPRFTRAPRNLAEAGRHIRGARSSCRAGTGLTFAVVDRRTRRVLGAVGFTDLAWWHPETWEAPGPDAAEIGDFWITHGDEYSGHSSEALLLTLRHAFEDWGVRRVSFSIDSQDERFIAAVEQSGAQRDGLRRAHSCGPDGTVRSRLLYSLLDTEWPVVENAAPGGPGEAGEGTASGGSRALVARTHPKSNP